MADVSRALLPYPHLHSIVQDQASTLRQQAKGDMHDKVRACVRTLFIAHLTYDVAKDRTDLSRAAHLMGDVQQTAATWMMQALNGDNSRPGMAFENLPLEVQAKVFDLLRQEGWVTVLGMPNYMKQLPFSLKMTLQQYLMFKANPDLQFFIGTWEQVEYWSPEMTPTPAAFPVFHLKEFIKLLTREVIYSLAAQLEDCRLIMQAAVADGALSLERFQDVKQAAAQSPLSGAALFLDCWVKQARAVVGVAVLQLLTAGRVALQQVLAQASVVLPVTPLATDSWGWGSGSGGRCHTALTAVGAGDGGSKLSKVLDVLLYADGKRAADVAGAATSFVADQQQAEPARLRTAPTRLRRASTLLHSIKARR
jgi:hypothetical protein